MLGWTLAELWSLDIQTIEDIRTIVYMRQDVREAMRRHRETHG